MLTITENSSVAEIVSYNIETIDVFKKYEIDFCCGGDVSLRKICDEKGLMYKELQWALQNISQLKNKVYDYVSWDVNFLMDHIVHIHHAYVTANIEKIQQYANKVANVHGIHYPELLEIKSLFREVSEALVTHMKEEEQVLFPYIKHLVAVQKQKEALVTTGFEAIENPIQLMEAAHENAGNLFKRISALAKNYTPPNTACTTLKAFYTALQEFEEDLHLHIHLENNILHPKALKLEEQMAK